MTAPTPIPISRSGIEINKTIGHATSASNAKGQHMTKRINQAKKLSMVL
jgi:hypothetical protein